MKADRKRIISVFFLILSTGLVSSAKNQKVRKNLTCDEFAKLDEVSRPKILYWMDGFNSYGQPVDETVDFDQNDRLVPILVQECTKNPSDLLANKIKEQKKHKSL